MVQTGSLAIHTAPRALGDGKLESDCWEKARKRNFRGQLSLDPDVIIPDLIHNQRITPYFVSFLLL